MEYTINITPLKKAFKKLRQFAQHLDTEQEKAGVVQAFEYTFELCWKMMKRFLEQRGRSAYSPKEVFRMAALEKFIEDPELWFEFLKKRNITAHTYEEEESNAVIEIVPAFLEEVEKLIIFFETISW
jgi:nucleotidyltransferase substrate binding protein (TIGR01987 family)